ncbi:unnamed protein product [Mytilus edulis]|uniref:Uncharacterized protein n=1 Tax=Mytilus edulis TaxID=6550 RepID=A0A8S3PTY8_MYTED|nr:unnamed protein product [Mytilus edulis]
MNEIEGETYDDELTEAMLNIIQPVNDTEITELTISAPTTENIAVTLAPNNNEMSEIQNVQNTETQKEIATGDLVSAFVAAIIVQIIDKDTTEILEYRRSERKRKCSIYLEAAVERSFNLMNDICTNDRNRLTQKNLDAIMRIAEEGKDRLSDTELEQLVDMFTNFID